MSSTWIGRLGALQEIRCPAPVEAPVERPSTPRLNLAGMRSIQRAPRSARRWTLSLAWATPAEVAALVELESGSLANPSVPTYWYDPYAAATNMLRPSVAAPGLWGDEPYEAVGGGTLTYSVLGGALPLIDVPLGEAVAPVVPVLEGRTYTASTFASASSHVGLRWVDADGVTLSTTAGSTGTGRLSATGAAPAGAGGVRVVLDPDVAGNFNRVQLTETATVIDWLPGEGIPRVSVSGMQRTHQAVWDDGTVRSDYTAELLEVG
ncbi:hypothetical protein [Jiangella asiatica]|uniref:Uncharacterized protein n=1 Tax=Jiangella asiatica TaxID=2530372 RepID=A0A4R5CQN7_9ACTN|nr:hypothetical protein [Jiangella asiatica]TDE02829.1 hypothetical protein E1269_21295 [Jiangella asiatica]